MFTQHHEAHNNSRIWPSYHVINHYTTMYMVLNLKCLLYKPKNLCSICNLKHPLNIYIIGFKLLAMNTRTFELSQSISFTELDISVRQMQIGTIDLHIKINDEWLSNKVFLNCGCLSRSMYAPSICFMVKYVGLGFIDDQNME